jgi:hypothetical protein
VFLEPLQHFLQLRVLQLELARQLSSEHLDLPIETHRVVEGAWRGFAALVAQLIQLSLKGLVLTAQDVNLHRRACKHHERECDEK